MMIPDAATHSFGPPPHCRTCGESDHTEGTHPRSAPRPISELEARLAADRLRHAIAEDTSGCDRWFELPTSHADVQLVVEYVLSGWLT